MTPVIDLTNRKFGRWLVLSRAKRTGVTRWNCLCECGSRREIIGQTLKNGRSKSCGCVRLGNPKDDNIKFERYHRRQRSSEIGIWLQMHARCEKPNTRQYENYGGRGIRVCEEWEVFKTFYFDMGPRPSLAHTIDRIDNDKHYSKDNCRWATRAEQNRNTRRNVWFTYRGKTMCTADWCKYLGIRQGIVQSRLYQGWTLERAILTPTKKVSRSNFENLVDQDRSEIA